MIKAALLTVQHTGTRATMRALSPCVDSFVGPDDAPIGNTVVWSHVIGGVNEDVCADLAGYPLIITVRDPLASLISTIGRRDDSAAQHLADWRAFIDLPLADALPVRIEQDTDADLMSVYTALNLYEQPLPFLSVGASQPTALSVAYQAGDFGYIADALPDEINALRSMQSQIEPRFSAWGYNSLMWYA